ncbi:MAG: AAA family ATPase [Phycisphaerae bacterium]
MQSSSALQALKKNIASVVIGKDEVVDKILTALLARGHVLLEDVPGVGKTLLSCALARSIDCQYRRIQLTPDMLPSDILGVSIYDNQTGQFVFRKGPIFTQILLADEINRTTPRTQSALLEAMNEAQVSADGQTFRLGPPFMVLATQNPYDFEGTYYLPENQLDRFMMRLAVGYPDRQGEKQILKIEPARTSIETLEPVLSPEQLVAIQDEVLAVRVDESIADYIVSIAEATRRSEDLTVGLSPRGSLALLRACRAAAVLDRRNYVVPDDVQNLAVDVCAHRLISKGLTSSDDAIALFTRILQTVPVPQ